MIIVFFRRIVGQFHALFCSQTFSGYEQMSATPKGGALKSRDLTTRHQVAGLDIARLILVCEYLLTTIFCMSRSPRNDGEKRTKLIKYNMTKTDLSLT